MTNQFNDPNGHLDYHLICPVCGKEGDIVYSKRIPQYCSNACRQKAYRERLKKRNNLSVTKLKSEWKKRFKNEQLVERLYAFYIVYGYDQAMDAANIVGSALSFGIEYGRAHPKRY